VLCFDNICQKRNKCFVLTIYVKRGISALFYNICQKRNKCFVILLETEQLNFEYRVAPIKLYVSFAEYSLFYMALLQKEIITLRSLLHVAKEPTNRSLEAEQLDFEYRVAESSRMPSVAGHFLQKSH